MFRCVAKIQRKRKTIYCAILLNYSGNRLTSLLQEPIQFAHIQRCNIVPEVCMIALYIEPIQFAHIQRYNIVPEVCTISLYIEFFHCYLRYLTFNSCLFVCTRTVLNYNPVQLVIYTAPSDNESSIALRVCIVIAELFRS